MNRMQKMAWVGFLGTLMFSVHFALTFTSVFLLPAYRRMLLFILFPVLVALVVGYIWCYRKQSRAEPDCDERDRQISRRAVIISFVGLCLLIYISDAVMLIWTGTGRHILTAMLPVIHFWLGLLALTLYYAAMLVLYRKGRAADE